MSRTPQSRLSLLPQSHLGGRTLLSLLPALPETVPLSPLAVTFKEAALEGAGGTPPPPRPSLERLLSARAVPVLACMGGPSPGLIFREPIHWRLGSGKFFALCP